MRLVIAEKPELARDIAAAVAGAPDNCKLPWKRGEWAVCSCAGHLLELAEPADLDPGWGKPWTEESLPIYMPNWPSVPAEGKRQLLDRVGRLLREPDVDVVYHCGDPDDEGQLIVDEVLKWFGWQGPVLRVLVNDSMPESIRKAFAEAKDNRRFAGQGTAAAARRVADKGFGVNESRLATIRMGTFLSVGRVQTPTLQMVAERDAAVEGHVETPCFWLKAQCSTSGGDAVEASFEPADGLKADGKHVLDRGLLEAVASKITGKALDAAITRREVVRNPPLPYNLTVLMSEMSRRHGLTASQVQEATQSLRDVHHAITYNRTDSRFLKDEQADEAPAALMAAAGNLGKEWDMDLSLRSKCFNSSKVTAHHAIIPQAKRFDVSRLSKDELLVYEAICERYAMQFMPAARFLAAELSASLPEGRLVKRWADCIAPGWRDQLGQTVPNDPLESLDRGCPPAGPCGMVVQVCRVEEGHTAPPKRFTDGTLIAAMSSIGRRVADPEVRRILLEKDADKPGESGGIGTTATRKDIIEKLVARGYLERKGKSLVSTQKGRALLAAVPQEVRGVEQTARWWLVQQDIAAGKGVPDDLQRKVAEAFERRLPFAYKDAAPMPGDYPAIGNCPRCGKPVLAKKKSFQCSSNRFKDGKLTEGCGFSVFRIKSGKRLTDKQGAMLLDSGRTGKLKGFKTRDGKPFKGAVAVVLDPETGKLSFDFDGD